MSGTMHSARLLLTMHNDYPLGCDQSQQLHLCTDLDTEDLDTEDFDVALDFEHQFHSAKVVSLGRNFRSTGHIVDASAGLIQRNASHRERTLHTELGEGDRVVVAGAGDEHDEAKQLVDLFREQFMQGTLWREMAPHLTEIGGGSCTLRRTGRRPMPPALQTCLT